MSTQPIADPSANQPTASPLHPLTASPSHQPCDLPPDGLSNAPFLSGFTNEEVAWIVQLKRFFEWVDGDPDFRQAMTTGKFSQEQLERLKRIGVTFHPDELELFWKAPSLLGANPEKAFCLTPEQAEKAREALSRYPLLELWLRVLRFSTETYRQQLGQIHIRIPKCPELDAWRLRRISSTRSELGFFSYILDHPILAFELGDGCSMGCWFCAFSSRKLTKNFDYTQNREFFRKVLRTCVELFGREQTSMSLLYYGTEPHDNPHYLDFIKDHAEITGSATCTATTACTDAPWIRELIAYYRTQNLPWPRLSVLSKDMLLKIHDLYTPEELRDVTLLMQMKDHSRCKVTGGRILKEHEGLRDREEGSYLDGLVPQGSIACVTGFLINMVIQRIQLVSPCYTSTRWPLGYRIFDEVYFKGPEDFGAAMQEIIDRSMPLTPPPQWMARLRDDLVYRETPEGFDLVSPNQVTHFHGKELYGALGSLIAEGAHTFDELYREALSTYRLNPLLVGHAVGKIFDEGFLDEAAQK